MQALALDFLQLHSPWGHECLALDVGFSQLDNTPNEIARTETASQVVLHMNEVREFCACMIL